MKQKIGPPIVALLSTILLAAPVLAEVTEHHEMTILVQTGDDPLIDADVSDLALGESRTFITDSGKTVDIVRTGDGVDLFIDGELQELGLAGDLGDHAVIHANVEIECVSDPENECETGLMPLTSDGDYADAHGDDHHRIVIEKQVEVICEQGQDCEELTLVSGTDDLSGAKAHKVIRIHRKADSANQ